MSSASPARVSPAHTTRWGRRLTIIVGATVLAGTAVATAVPATAHPARFTPSASATRAPLGVKQPATIGPTSGTVHYAVNKPACAIPKNPNRPRCFAVKRVEVSKGTKHAYSYVESNALTHGPHGGYTPADLASAYGYNPKANRRSQLVGIIDWFDDPDALSDLNKFDHTYHLKKETATSFRKVNQLGHATPLPKRDKDSSGEIALDVESVRAVCNTCRILLVEANTGTDKNLAIAENLAAKMGATEISNSFGETEHKVPASVRKAYNHPGVVITASTGDDGWFAWDNANSGGKSANAPEYPSSDPNVIAVGGTELVLKSTGHRAAEDVWNENGPEDGNGKNGGGAGGGGCSKLYSAAPWQSHYKGYAGAGCKGKRLAADISAIADPTYGFDILDSFSGGWGTYGGTSLASPVIAAMYALAGGSGGSAYPAASLYVNGTHRASALFDVKVGGNGFCAGDATYNCGEDVYDNTTPPNANPNALGVGNIDCSFPRSSKAPTNAPPFSSECNAVAGYDGPSGLGTPQSDKLFTPTSAELGITHNRLIAQKSKLLQAHLKQRVAHTKAVRFLWNFGDHKSATTTAGKVRHTWHKAGTYTITLTEIDNRYQRSVRYLRVVVHKP